jgi:hypothetical protein
MYIGVDTREKSNTYTAGFDINFLTNLSIWASAILILLARNCNESSPCSHYTTEFSVYYFKKLKLSFSLFSFVRFWISMLLILLINARENRWGNEEWTIQRHRQHRVHKTQDEDKQNNKQLCQERMISLSSTFIQYL